MSKRFILTIMLGISIAPSVFANTYTVYNRDLDGPIKDSDAKVTKIGQAEGSFNAGTGSAACDFAKQIKSEFVRTGNEDTSGRGSATVVR